MQAHSELSQLMAGTRSLGQVASDGRKPPADAIPGPRARNLFVMRLPQTPVAPIEPASTFTPGPIVELMATFLT